MRIFKPVVSKISSVLRKLKTPKVPKPRPFATTKKPSVSKVGVGHRGIAMGSDKKPDFSPENIAKWHTTDDEEGVGFIYNAQPFFVHSTNVAMLQYFIETEKLMVEFKDGSAYLYSNVTEREARLFWTGQSKGHLIWTLLRIPGTKHGHKKPFVQLR